MPELAFADGFYQADSRSSMNMLCQNMYPTSVTLSDGTVLNRLETTPGISSVTQLSTLSGDPGIRCITQIDDFVYAVNGGDLWRFSYSDPDTTKSVLGSITGSGQLSVADNGTQIMIVDPENSNGYIYNTSTSTFAEITDADFKANGNPKYVIFIDGYFMASTDSNKFIISALRDGTSWNALDFGSAESDPDPIVGLTNFKNEAYVFGSETCEAFDNIGGADFPFRRNGLILDKGLVSPLSITQSANTFMWIGAGRNEQPAVYALGGSEATRISTPAIELLLKELTSSEKVGVTGAPYMQDGLFFACWTLPTVCICYDVYNNKWHTRRSKEENNGPETTWRAEGLTAMSNGDVICGDRFTGRIGKLDRDVYTDYLFSNIVRIHDARPIRAEQKAFSLPVIELAVESGTGFLNPPTARDVDVSSTDPVVRMETSRDAFTFNNERPRSIGKTGKRRQRVKWRRNGRFTDYAQFRFTMSDAVPYTVTGVYADFVVGRG